MFELPINEDNFLRITLQYYDNPQCHSIAEFEEDLKRFRYLNKLFNRYNVNNDLKERLILNHLIILYNCFGVITTELLFFKIDKQYWNYLATFLIFLNRMPDEIPEFNISLIDLQIDNNIANTLRKM